MHDQATSWQLAFRLDEIGAESAWLGLSDRGDETVWRWVDGSDLDCVQWTPESPLPAGERLDCAVLSLRGWIDAPCSEARPFVCR